MTGWRRVARLVSCLVSAGIAWRVVDVITTLRFSRTGGKHTHTHTHGANFLSSRKNGKRKGKKKSNNNSKLDTDYQLRSINITTDVMWISRRYADRDTPNCTALHCTTLRCTHAANTSAGATIKCCNLLSELETCFRPIYWETHRSGGAVPEGGGGLLESWPKFFLAQMHFPRTLSPWTRTASDWFEQPN